MKETLLALIAAVILGVGLLTFGLQQGVFTPLGAASSLGGVALMAGGLAMMSN